MTGSMCHDGYCELEHKDSEENRSNVMERNYVIASLVLFAGVLFIVAAIYEGSIVDNLGDLLPYLTP